jgi:hypothetical protein
MEKTPAQKLADAAVARNIANRTQSSVATNTPTTTPAPQNPINYTPTYNTFWDVQGSQQAPKAETFTQATQSRSWPTEMVFWQQASTLESQNQWYLQYRNDQIAKSLYDQGITSTQAIQERLMSNVDFASATMAEKANTAQAIANRMGQFQTQPPQGAETTQPTTQQWLSQWYVHGDELALLDKEVERGQQAYLQDVQRAGIVGLDRPTEDLERNKMLQMRNIERQIENTRIWVNQQIEDIMREANRSIEMWEKVWALKGFWNSSGYIQWLDNIRQDSDRMIGRLQEMLQRAETATEEDKAQIMQDFNTEVARARENFEYNMRDVMDSARVEVNNLIERYGFSSDKLQNNLERVTYDVLMKREQVIAQYTQNTRSQIQIANDQLNVLQNYDNFLWQERDRYTATLNSNGGVALASMTPQDIDKAVSQWMLTQAQWQAYKQVIVWKSVNTLQTAWKPTDWDIQNLMNMIQSWVAPAEAIARIIADNPSRYTEMQNQRSPVSGQPGVFRRMDEKGNLQFTQHTATNQPMKQQAGQQTTNQTTKQDWLNEWLLYPTDSIGAFSQNERKRELLQCGELVNDYIKMVTGTKWWLGNSYNDKVKWAEAIWLAVWPVVGGIFVQNVQTSMGNTGHTGIVTWVNPDGSIEVYDANALENSMQGWKPTTRTIPANVAKNFVFTQAPGGTWSINLLGADPKDAKKLLDLWLTQLETQDVLWIIAWNAPVPAWFGANSASWRKIMSWLAALWYDWPRAQLDMVEMQQLAKTMNSTSFVRLWMSIDNMYGSVWQAERFYEDWKKTWLPTWFKALNSKALQAAAALPGEKWVAARTLISHIDDMKAELATIYRLGNSPTDSTLEQATRSLDADWNEEQFTAALRLIEENLRIKKNSFKTARVVDWNRYSPEQASGLIDVKTWQPMWQQPTQTWLVQWWFTPAVKPRY